MEKWYHGRLSVDESNAVKLILLRLIAASNAKQVLRELVSSIVSKGHEYSITEKFLWATNVTIV